MSTFEDSDGNPVPEVTFAREGVQLLPAGALRLRHAVFQSVTNMAPAAALRSIERRLSIAFCVFCSNVIYSSILDIPQFRNGRARLVRTRAAVCLASSGLGCTSCYSYTR